MSSEDNSTEDNLNEDNSNEEQVENTKFNIGDFKSFVKYTCVSIFALYIALSYGSYILYHIRYDIDDFINK